MAVVETVPDQWGFHGQLIVSFIFWSSPVPVKTWASVWFISIHVGAANFHMDVWNGRIGIFIAVQYTA